MYGETQESIYSDTESSHDYLGPFNVFFVLGKPKDNNVNCEKEQLKILDESNKFGDIIQIDVEETYHNCFYKGQ